ncbi:MAG: sensor histidine kinase, partial [Planctomycetes bacterium]|nr:sensor histidine kinase [Planctomycetota bacterium]
LLMNLILNAIQAQHGQEHDAEVHIEINGDGFSVFDSGPGVPEKISKNLFSAFSSDKESGTGLGLHLARAIAEAHQGELSYTRELKTCFRLSGLRTAIDVD